MFTKDKISFAKFILCLILPFVVVSNYRLNRFIHSVDFQKSRNIYNVKEILSEMFQESLKQKIPVEKLCYVKHGGCMKGFC